MTRLASQPHVSPEEAERLEFEAELDGSADRVFNALEKARNKMTPEERERAERNSASILRSATGSAKPARRRA